MLLYFIRALFVIIIAAVLFVGITTASTDSESDVMVLFVSGLGVAIIVILIDWLTPRKSLIALAGVFFGLLVGALLSWVMSPILENSMISLATRSP